MTEQPDNTDRQATIDRLTAENEKLRQQLIAKQPHRERLPDTRDSVTHKFSVSGHEGYLIVGLYEDARPGEVFLTMAKQGSTMSGLVNAIAILISLCLQHGIPIESLARKFQHMRFEPSGHTTNREISTASSIMDYIFTFLGIRYSDQFRDDYEQLNGMLDE